mgnify:CR=1 FL=1
MGKSTGFLEYERNTNETVSPLERIKNFSEFHRSFDFEERKKQAARCMNCGVPFCQSGENFGGMTSGCPLHNLIPEWNDEVYNGNLKQALKRLLKTNNFPEFTGRVCPALCEAACTCGMNFEPVTVHDNELYIIENGFKNEWIDNSPPAVRSGKKVAVIGSGPSGLAVADELNKRGHNVTVFEKAGRIGGLLMYGIPNMKLDKSVIKRRFELMKSQGIQFSLNTDVGKDITVEELKKEYDSVVLCCGSKKARDLNVSGRDAKGVYFAVDYLTSATRCVIGDTKLFEISAKGKNVVIVGGGDTGNDCVGTAVRQGAKSVIQLEITSRPPEKRTPQNPWPQWPRVLKTDYGQEEAAAVFGSDPRIYNTTVKEIIKDKNGSVCEIKTVQTEFVKDAVTGKSTIKEISGSEKTVKCELLLIAAGFVGCEDYIFESKGIEKTARGCISADEDSYAVRLPGVFAAGDARRGQSLVVWAIAEGRACAGKVDEFLCSGS